MSTRLREVVAAAVSAIAIAVISFAAGFAANPRSDSHLIARTADEWVALGTWATVAIASGAAIVGLRQAREARQLRIEQAQAYVVAYIVQNRHVAEAVELVIKNVGVTAAKDVRVAVDRPLLRTPRLGSGQVPEKLWFPDRIPFLAPGQEWRTVWDFTRSRNESDALQDDPAYEMTITYTGVEAAGRQTTVAALDWAPFKGRIWMDEKTVHHAAKAIVEMRTLMKGWTERRKLSVIMRDGSERDERLRAEMDRRLAQQEVQEEGVPDNESIGLTGDAEPRIEEPSHDDD
ncbi:hypothetical protein [Cellulosimicrobium funkei]|uniref:hypothetical protein n=1 Tax=Cellulosimicrobium funkei TaxID=264251 RepID=UPI0030FAE513